MSLNSKATLFSSPGILSWRISFELLTQPYLFIVKVEKKLGNDM